MRTWITRLSLVGATCLFAASAALAATQARIEGAVENSRQEPIAGARIVITSPELSSFNKVVETDTHGRYKVMILDATKHYVFRAEAPGYSPSEQSVKVQVGSMNNQVDFTLNSEKEAAAAQQKKMMARPGYKELDEAYALLKEGKKAEARDKLKEAVAIVPDMTQAWATLAEVEYELQDYKQSLEDARACLQLDEDSTSCLASAANAAAKVGDEEAYKTYMAHYQELNPGDPATLFNQAAEYLNAMDDEAARPLLEECLEVDPTFSKCLFEYGMLLLRTGDLQGAKQQLEKYLEVAPDGDDAATARETIKYL